MVLLRSLILLLAVAGFPHMQEALAGSPLDILTNALDEIGRFVAIPFGVVSAWHLDGFQTVGRNSIST